MIILLTSSNSSISSVDEVEELQCGLLCALETDESRVILLLRNLNYSLAVHLYNYYIVLKLKDDAIIVHRLELVKIVTSAGL